MIKNTLENQLAEIYVRFYMEQGFLQHNPEIEPLEIYTKRQKEIVKDSLKDFKKRIAQGIEHILTHDILSPEQKNQLQNSLHTSQEEEKFWTTLAEGKPPFELLHIPFETLLAIYDHAIKEINEGHLDSAFNQFLILTLLCPLMSQFWLGLGMASFFLKEYQPALINFMRAVALSSYDRDEVVALLWCYDCLKMLNEDEKAQEIKQLALDTIDRNTDLDDLKQIAQNKN